MICQTRENRPDKKYNNKLNRALLFVPYNFNGYLFFISENHYMQNFSPIKKAGQNEK